jgi:hypothetical protein
MRTTTIAFALAAGLLAAPLQPAMAQLPSGNTGLGDARAQDLPTSVGIRNGQHRGGYGGFEGRSGWGHRGWGPRRHWGWRRHHRHW